MSLRQETTSQRAATNVPVCALAETPLRGVRPNIVQSIRAFRVPELQDTAQSLGQHFLYANLANAQSKQDVLDLIGHQFMLSVHVGKNFDALYDSMTDPLHKSGPQPGFIVVLEHIPANGKFDKEAREQLLDIFRDAADYWGDRKYRSDVSILFCSPFCTHQPSRTGESGIGCRRHQSSATRHREHHGIRRKNADRQIIGHLSAGTAHEQPL